MTAKRISPATSYLLLAMFLISALLVVGCTNEPEVDTSLYTGTWELESGSDQDLSASALAELKKGGAVATLELNENGTGEIALFGTDPLSLTWTATTSTEGSASIGDDKATIQLQDGKLTLTNSRSETLTFTRP